MTANQQTKPLPISMHVDFGGDTIVLFLMQGSSTLMHPAIVAHLSSHFIGIISRRRIGIMEIVLGRLNMLCLLLWSLLQLGAWARKPPSFITDLLTYCPTKTMYHMTLYIMLAWLRCMRCLSHCYDLLQCASAAARLSPIDQLMLHQRWAWLTTTRYIYIYIYIVRILGTQF